MWHLFFLLSGNEKFIYIIIYMCVCRVYSFSMVVMLLVNDCDYTYINIYYIDIIIYNYCVINMPCECYP